MGSSAFPSQPPAHFRNESVSLVSRISPRFSFFAEKKSCVREDSDTGRSSFIDKALRNFRKKVDAAQKERHF